MRVLKKWEIEAILWALEELTFSEDMPQSDNLSDSIFNTIEDIKAAETITLS